MNERTEHSRRRLLRATGGATAALLLAGCGGPGEGEEPGTDPSDVTDDEDEIETESGAEEGEDGAEGDEDGWDDIDRIELDANEDGWNGRRPSFIEGEMNPTLELYAGREYEFVWENNDGEDHNFAIYDDQTEMESTEIDDEELETHSMTVEASTEMVEYLCEVHPDTMAGDIEVRET